MLVKRTVMILCAGKEAVAIEQDGVWYCSLCGVRVRSRWVT